MAIAVQRGASVEELERLLALKERVDAAAALRAHNEAFAAFKQEAVAILRTKKVTDGPLKGKAYAELHSVVSVLTPLLSKHGLSAAWKLTKDEKDWLEVTCYLRHVGGHVESCSMGGPPDVGGAKNPIQARASTKSYLERYTLKAITGLAEQDEDDDGNGAGGSDDLLQGFQDAAMNGTAALRKHYEAKAPDDAWWSKHSKALKAAAAAADKAGTR